MVCYMIIGISSKIENCYNTGNISGLGKGVGGICGRSWQNTYITKCYNKDCTILGGDLVACVGGICGVSRGEISEVYNLGQIGSEERASEKVGGVVGVIARGGVLKNSYNFGNVYGEKTIGGICGHYSVEASMTPIIKMCYNTGSISSRNGAIATIVCHDKGLSINVQNCYYQETENLTGISDTQGTKIVDVNGVVEAKTESELKNKSTFVNWDFENIWKINEGVSMPSLKNILLENVSL